MDLSTKILTSPALTRVVFEKEVQVCRWRVPSPVLFDGDLQKPSDVVGVVLAGPCLLSVFAEFEELFQPVLLGLGLGEPCFDLDSEARDLELDGHHGF